MRRVLAAVVVGFTPWLAQAADSIRVYNWNDYIDPSVLADFQRETGIEVQYVTYSTTEEITKALHSDEAIDVAIAPHNLLTSLRQNERIVPLDFDQLPNRVHLDRELLAKQAITDPGNQYAIPYLWSAVGIALNVPQAEAAYGGPLPESWGLLYDNEINQRLASCGISLIDAPDELYSGLLNYQGHRYSRSTERRLARATETLMELRPHLRYIDSERYIDDLNNGKLCAALAWSGDALVAADAGQPVRFIIPEEGSALGIDNMTIPVTSTKQDLAYRFINYMMQPQVAAKISSATFYASGNHSAKEFLSPELQNNPAMFPDTHTKRRLALLESLPPKLEQALANNWEKVLAQ